MPALSCPPDAPRLAAADVAALLDVPLAEVHRSFPGGRLPHDLRYLPLAADERDATILRVLRALGEGAAAKAGPARRERWEEGWGEHLAAVEREGFRPELLAPRYFRPDVVRLDGGFVHPLAPSFEHDAFAVLRRLVFARWLRDVASVVELGCGTGMNLVALLDQFPELTVVGGDWARASQELLRLAARDTGRRIAGVFFDMFHPEKSDAVAIDGRTAVLTVHALEQLGREFQPLLDWLVARAPARCVHIEPLVELYDPDRLVDHLAREYHRQRGYLEGWVGAVRALADAGRAEILVERRVRFGSLFHEAYSLLVWRPV